MRKWVSNSNCRRCTSQRNSRCFSPSWKAFSCLTRPLETCRALSGAPTNEPLVNVKRPSAVISPGQISCTGTSRSSVGLLLHSAPALFFPSASFGGCLVLPLLPCSKRGVAAAAISFAIRKRGCSFTPLHPRRWLCFRCTPADFFLRGVPRTHPREAVTRSLDSPFVGPTSNSFTDNSSFKHQLDR